MELVLRCVHAARKRCRCYWALGHLKVDNLAPVLFAEQHDRDRRVLAGLDLPSSWCQHHHAIVINGPTTPCSAGCTLPVAFLIRGAGHQGGIRGAVSGGPSSSGGLHHQGGRSPGSRSRRARRTCRPRPGTRPAHGSAKPAQPKRWHAGRLDRVDRLLCAAALVF